VIVIVMENRGFDQVAGDPSAAPYLAGLGRECGLATGYSGVAHPSLPNYLALTSGSTHGITDDGGPSTHPVTGPSIFSLLGPGWRSLQESMPSPCDHSSGGDYATKHNPAVYFTSIAAACPAQDVPMDDAAPDVGARFTLITPNLCNDGHNCSTAAADHWLSSELPLILDGPEYRSGTAVVFVTWDENDAGGTRVPTYVVAPSVPPGLRVGATFDHYSLLRTAEELLRLRPLLGAAAMAPSMKAAFHL
jgi:acid phosphatase